jgi:hypothetical protein
MSSMYVEQFSGCVGMCADHFALVDMIITSFYKNSIDCTEWRLLL